MDERGPARGARPVRVCRHRFRLPGLFVRRQRFFGSQRRQQFQFQPAVVLPLRRDLGKPRRLVAAVGADAHRVDAGGDAVQPPSAP